MFCNGASACVMVQAIGVTMLKEQDPFTAYLLGDVLSSLSIPPQHGDVLALLSCIGLARW